MINMSWKITRNQTGYPLEILVDDTTIALTGSALDDALPIGGDEAGVIVYNADFSVIKQRDFDGTWKVVE